MIGHLCGGSNYPVEVPDLGAPCCYGAAIYGAQACTCWEPVYDLAQQQPRTAVPQVRATPCADCAYRGGSPERRGDPEYAGSGAELDRIVEAGEPFYCHQGIRRPVRYRHPSGAEVEGHAASYDPPIVVGVPHRADGAPADLCAGWAARRLRALAEAGL
jgi:hypothetical protein